MPGPDGAPDGEGSGDSRIVGEKRQDEGCANYSTCGTCDRATTQLDGECLECNEARVERERMARERMEVQP